MKKISIIVPVYNESDCLIELTNRISQVFSNYQNKYSYELIFVNDGSQDRSAVVIFELLKTNPNIKYLEFSRNFGKEIALTAGLHHADGDATIMIDADLQHPPEFISKLIEEWEKGGEIIVGVRKENNYHDWVKNLGSKLFYKLMNWCGEIKFIPRGTDFRLLDKLVLMEFNKFTERNRITRGLINWLGFDKRYLEFDVGIRRNGQARYSKLKLTKLALSSFVSNSLLPLKFAGYLGIFITLISGLIGLHIIIFQYVFHSNISFYISTMGQFAILNIFLIGVVLSCLGLIALYIGNIHQEVANRPLYIVKKKQNFK